MLKDIELNSQNDSEKQGIVAPVKDCIKDCITVLHDYFILKSVSLLIVAVEQSFCLIS